MALERRAPHFRSHGPDSLLQSLHLFVLWNFAVAQPLFDLFSRTAEFFVLRQSQPLDIILFVVLLCGVFPALSILVIWGVRAIHVGLSRGLHLLLIGCLSTALALQALQTLQALPDVSGMALLLGAGLIGLLTSVSYHALSSVRTFFTLLSPGLLLFPVLFLFFSPVSDILFFQSADIAHVKIKDPHPIVLVVFDEFSLISLMDENRQIDPQRYPNFAAFAQEATWFRNASTVSNWTPQAVPAILTGTYPPPHRLPTAAEYPRNIFTLLGGTYAFQAHGTITELCPHELCDQFREPWSTRIRALLSDVTIIYLHLLLPEDQKSNLPSLQTRWRDFAGSPSLTQQAKDHHTSSQLWQSTRDSLQDSLLAQLNIDRPQVFRNFLRAIQSTERETLYYIHSLLPHAPYTYLPSGQTYSADDGLTGLTKEVWTSDEWAVTQNYQRYLLQVGFVDALLGQLIARLKSAGLYEKSLIVITADHGVSFRPLDSRREISQTNFPDIMAIPLFVKQPFQRRGEIRDHNVETVDILPTIADILGVELPWSVDGVSAFSPELQSRVEKSGYPSTPLSLDVFDAAVRAAVKRQAHLFPHDSPPLPQAAPPGILGKRIQDLPIIEDPDLAILIDQSALFSQRNLETHFLPVHITGTLYSQDAILIALVLNGTVRALTHPWPFVVKGKYGQWSAVIAPQFFAPDTNSIEAFGLLRRKGQVSLVRATGSPQHLPIFQPPDETLVAPSGKRRSLSNSAFDGWVDHAARTERFLEIAGWAANIKDAQLPQEIWVYVNGKFFHSGPLNSARPDVVQHFGDPALHQSGFRYTLPLAQLKKNSSLTLRLFAVSKEERISELHYPPALRGAGTPHPAILLNKSSHHSAQEQRQESRDIGKREGAGT